MRLTLSEVEFTAFRAARGAGLDWGLAEEAAFAARWLVEQGIDGLSLLLARLQDQAAGVGVQVAEGLWWPDGSGRLCPIAVGAGLGDAYDLPEGLGAGPLTLAEVSTPALLLPFLARKDAVEVLWPETRALVAEGRLLALEGTGLTAPVAQVRVTRHRRRAGVLDLDPLAIAALQPYIQRTYVPASDTSRRGAGGAGTDNA